MLKIFNNGKLGFWILGALWGLVLLFFGFNWSGFVTRLDKVEAAQEAHITWADSTERSFRFMLIKINVKTNRILRELGYSDRDIQELEQTAIIQP